MKLLLKLLFLGAALFGLASCTTTDSGSAASEAAFDRTADHHSAGLPQGRSHLRRMGRY